MNPFKINSSELVKIASIAITDKKGENTVAFDVRKSSSLTDYFVITSGLNPPHLKALFNETCLKLKENGFSCFQKTGTPESGWIVADYLDIIIHFFIPECRKYYALEELYGNAPKLEFTTKQCARQKPSKHSKAK